VGAKSSVCSVTPKGVLWQVYKGGAAMNFKVIKPSWEYRADGALAMKDAGVALLEFAPAQQGSGTAPGERRYDWDNKTVHTMQLCTRQSKLLHHCHLSQRC